MTSTGSGGEITIRELEGMAEYRRAVAFQNEVWGPGFTEAVPASMQKVTQRVGGVAGGAFDESGEMVGFVYGLTGIERGELVHWSDILAVRTGLRDGGIGQALKWHQRAHVLDLGVKVMRWTFDPLESRNGWVNLERLGAVADEYIPDMYGVSQSALHRGIGTDRLVARWDLERVTPESVERARTASPAMSGADPESRPEPEAEPEAVRAFDLIDDAPRDGLTPPAPGRSYRIHIPADIQSLRDRDPDLAQRWRAATRAALTSALGDGYEVRGVERTSETISTYRLEPPDQTP